MTAEGGLRGRILIAVIWFMFIIKSLLYIAVTPLWEGFDEPFHFAYVHLMASTRPLPVWGEAFVDAEIARSTAYIPLADLMPQLTAPHKKISYSDYWRMDPQERGQFEEQLHKLEANANEYSPSNIANYQIQHPPLYYSLCALLYRALNGYSLVDKVFAIRIFSVLLASLCVVAAALIAREIDSRFPAALVMLVAAWPCHYIDIARVGNDCLGIALFSFLFLSMIRYGSSRSTSSAATLGVLLGLGLITKAYFLIAVPAILAFSMLLAFQNRNSHRKILRDVFLIMLCAGALGGWWYLRNYRLYGSFSGLQESVLFPSVGLRERIMAVVDMPWVVLLKNFFVTFCWVNGWSFLRLPKLFYLVFIAIFTVAAIGLFRAANSYRTGRTGDRAGLLAATAAACLLIFFGLGALYHQVNAYATVKSLGGPGGWYLYALVVPISFLVLSGLENAWPGLGRWTPLVAVASLALVELYGVLMVLVPYYTGLAAPAAGGWGTSFAGGPVALFSRETAIRLLANKPHGLSVGALVAIGFAYCALQASVLGVGLFLAKADSPSENGSNSIPPASRR